MADVATLATAACPTKKNGERGIPLRREPRRQQSMGDELGIRGNRQHENTLDGHMGHEREGRAPQGPDHPEHHESHIDLVTCICGKVVYLQANHMRCTCGTMVFRRGTGVKPTAYESDCSEVVVPKYANRRAKEDSDGSNSHDQGELLESALGIYDDEDGSDIIAEIGNGTESVPTIESDPPGQGRPQPPQGDGADFSTRLD